MRQLSGKQSKEMISKQIGSTLSVQVPMDKLLKIICFHVILISVLSCSTNIEQKYKEHVEEGVALYKEEKYVEAIRHWEKALQYEKDSSQVYRRIGFAYYKTGDVENAERYLERAVELKHDDIEVLRKIGEIKIGYGDIAGAEKIWGLIEKKAKGPENYMFYGDLLYAKRRYEDAEKAYAKAQGLDTENQVGKVKQAICLFQQGQIKNAEKIYNTLSSNNQNNAKYNLLLADYCRMAVKSEREKEYLTKALELEASSEASRLRLAEIYISESQYDKAIETLRPISNGKQLKMVSRKILAEMLMTLNLMEEAEQVLNDLFQENAGDIEVLMLKGRYHLMNREPSIALSYYRAIVEINPEIPVTHYMMGVSYLMGGYNQLGLTSLIDALSIDNEFTDAELVIAGYYYSKKEYKLALEYARRIIEKKKKSYRGYVLLGNIFLSNKEYEDAIKMFKTAESINQNEISATYFKGIALELKGEINKATKVYREILDDNKNMIEVNKRYARLLSKSDRHEEALSYFENNKNKIDEKGHTLQIIGEIFLSSGQYNKSIAKFTEALDENPRLGSSYIYLSNLYKEKKEIDKQKDILVKAIDNIHGFSQAYIQLSSIYLHEKEYDDAIHLLEEALKSDSENPYLKNNLATIYLEHDNEVNKAFEYAQTAYEKMPNNPAFADTLGWAYYKKGIYDRAIWYFKDALEKSEPKTFENKIKQNGGTKNPICGTKKNNSSLFIIHYHLVNAFLKKENMDAAEYHLKKGFEHCENKKQKDRLKKLQLQLKKASN